MKRSTFPLVCGEYGRVRTWSSRSRHRPAATRWLRNPLPLSVITAWPCTPQRASRRTARTRKAVALAAVSSGSISA